MDKLLADPRAQALIADYTRPVVVDTLRATLADLRQSLPRAGQAPDCAAILARAGAQLAGEQRQRLRGVVNGTGIILHTGLGRAVLPSAAVAAMLTMDRCCSLQIDLATGLRGKRHYLAETLVQRLTGAAAAFLANNNAAATLLVLAALGRGREVIVSRGQLIEIGGSYRLPDCVHESGARLVEVGTTNKTHLADYARAITDQTAAILHVHPSNYRIVGFAKEVPVRELVTLKQQHPALLVLDDLGCGALVDLQAYGLPHEPTMAESLAAGADLVFSSGDKLIGGPQCGIIAGRADLVQAVRKHPLARMLRVGKLTGMALEQTLRLFLDPGQLLETHPTLRMMTRTPADLRRKAMALRRQASARAPAHLQLDVIECASSVGGGALPGVDLPSFALALTSTEWSADQLAARLRHSDPPIIARIERDAVLLDMRTLLEGDDSHIIAALDQLE